MNRWSLRILSVAFACLALAAELLWADDHVLRKQISSLRDRWIQNCVIGAEETEDECEGRWIKALEA